MIKKLTIYLLIFTIFINSINIKSCFAEIPNFDQQIEQNTSSTLCSDLNKDTDKSISEESINELIKNISEIKAELATSNKSKSEKKRLENHLRSLEAQLNKIAGTADSKNPVFVKNVNEIVHIIISKLYDSGCKSANFVYSKAKLIGILGLISLSAFLSYKFINSYL